MGDHRKGPSMSGNRSRRGVHRNPQPPTRYKTDWNMGNIFGSSYHVFGSDTQALVYGTAILIIVGTIIATVTIGLTWGS